MARQNSRFFGSFFYHFSMIRCICSKKIRDLFVIELFLTLALESSKITNLSRKKTYAHLSTWIFSSYFYARSQKLRINHEFSTNYPFFSASACKNSLLTLSITFGQKKDSLFRDRPSFRFAFLLHFCICQVDSMLRFSSII